MTVQTKANLATRAAQIRNETAGFANDGTRVGGLLQDMVDTFTNIVTVSASDGAGNTTSIQAAIDAAHAAYLAGGGVVEVRLPDMVIPLAASTLPETYWNYGVQVPANNGCLAMRDGVTLRGQGVGKTVLTPSSPTLDAVYIVDGNNQTVADLEITSGSATLGAGHAILQVNSANNTLTPVANLLLTDLYCHDVGSYGIGIENGVFTNVLVRNFRTKNTGADGIDVKNRPWPTNDAKGITLDNLYIESPGQRLDAQTGIDIRGRVHGGNITVVGVGRTGVSMTGIRFRTAGADEGFGDRASVVGFYVRCTAPGTANALGVDVGGADCAIMAGVVQDCAQGVTIGGNGSATAQRNTVSAVQVISATNEAFYTYASATQYNTFIGCHAYNSGFGFSADGLNTSFVGCRAIGCSTQHRVGAGAIQTEHLAGNDFEVDHLAIYSTAAGRVVLEARGASTDVDVEIDPKGAGLVKFGTAVAKAAEAFSHVVQFKTSDGVTHKLMVAT